MPSDQPRLDRWRDRARDHRVLAPLLAAAAVVILVGAVIGAVQTIVDVGSDATKTTPRTTTSPGTPVDVGDLGRDVNQRYAFSFAYPRAWSRRLTATASDPVNDDGATYVAPRAPGVQVAAWGSLGTLGSGRDAASRLRDELRLADENGDDVLEQGAYGLFWERRAGAPAAQRRRIPGYRLVVRFDDAETKRSVTAVKIVTRLEARDVTLQCQAPTTAFARYADACDRLAGSLLLQRFGTA
jgi:hypothetical protein